MNFHILTLFPEMVDRGLGESIIGRARQSGVINVETVNIRDFSGNKHNRVDDYTYGGGAGMLMQAQPVFDAYEYVSSGIEKRSALKNGIDHKDGTKKESTKKDGTKKVRCLYVTPQGQTFDQRMARELAKEEDLIILCGHYEGIDDRVLDEVVTDYVSIGDYVLTGGELAAMVMVDAISRLVPGVLGNDDSSDMESFRGNLLEYPQYSRPEVWHDVKVPEVLLSGNAAKISGWRLEQARIRTSERRPDLYEKYLRDQNLVEEWLKEDKRTNIDMAENISRGLSRLLYSDQNMDIIYNEMNKTAMLRIRADQDKELEMDWAKSEGLKKLPAACKSLVVRGCSFNESETGNIYAVLSKMGFAFDSEFYNYVYTKKEQVTCRLPKDLTEKASVEVRQLDESFTEKIEADYTYADQDYIRRHLRAKRLYGLFVDETLAAYAGSHEEGSMGFLFVEPEYRNKGLGKYMEGYIINLHRSYGYTPFCRAEANNVISDRVQESLGLYKSKKTVVWLCR